MGFKSARSAHREAQEGLIEDSTKILQIFTLFAIFLRFTLLDEVARILSGLFFETFLIGTNELLFSNGEISNK